MLKVRKILKAVNDILKNEFKVSVYGKETKEGYKMPCFHTEIIINPMERMNKHIVKTSLTINIAYLMEVVDQVKQFEVIERMQELFIDTIEVEDRVLHIKEISQEFTGEYNDILEFSIDIEFYENRYKRIIDKPIEEVDLRLKRKGDNSIFRR